MTTTAAARPTKARKPRPVMPPPPSREISVTGAEADFSYDTAGRVAEVDRKNTTTGTPGTSTTRLTYPSATQTLVAGPNTSTGTAVATGPHTTYTIGTGYLASASIDEMGRSRGATYTPNLDTATATSGTGATAGTTTAAYGANSGNSRTSLQQPGGATSNAAYANTSPATSYLPSSSTDDSGNQSTFTYNGAGNALTSTNTALTATATLTYNTNGDGTVVKATAPGNGTNGTVYAYNADHQLTTVTAPTVTAPTGPTLGVKTTTYDLLGRVATTTDGKGVTLTYTYDSIDRLLTTAYSDTTGTVTNTYDNAGQLLTSTSATGTITNTYDQLERLLTTANSAGGGTETYTYDKASNLLSTTNGFGTTTNSFDASGVLTQAIYPHNGSTAMLGFATDDQGRRTDEWLQTNPSHSAWTSHVNTAYDTSGRISRLIGQTGTGNASNTTVFDTSYCFNSGSAAPACGAALTADHSKLQWSLDNLTGQVSTFTYDAGGRIKQVAQSAGTASNNTYAYTYDANGNRLTAVVTGATPSSQTLTYNAANQITTTGYSYDGAGNLTASPTAAYSYNGAEQMIQAIIGTRTTTYTYAGTSQNRVLSESTAGAGATYNLVYGRNDQQGQPVIAQYNVSTKQAYVYSDPKTGQALMLTTSLDQNGIYVYDGIGNPVGLLTNIVAFNTAYDPYGGPTLVAGGTGNGYTQNPYAFKGGIQDRASGLVKFGIRWYNTMTGTFTQQDTLDAPLNPGNANRYAYAGNDPINLIDPSGLCTLYTFSAVAGAIGGAVALAGGTIGGAIGLLGGPFTAAAGAAGGAVIGGAVGLVGGSVYAGVTNCSEA